MDGVWYGPVAITTWPAVKSPWVVLSSKVPLAARRSPVTDTPSTSGGRKNAT
jgi:hypothetical protein